MGCNAQIHSRSHKTPAAHMKKHSNLMKIVKWISIITGVFLLTMNCVPMEANGKGLFGCSGWSALFDDNDFGLKINYYPEATYNGMDVPYPVSEKIYNVNSNNRFIF